MLAAPTTADGMYTRAFRLTENAKEGLVATAAAVGNPTPANSAECTMCTGDGVLDTGFRAQVYGIVTALADGDTPPMVHVVDASVSDGASSACTGDFPTEQNTVFGAALEMEDSMDGNTQTETADDDGGRTRSEMIVMSLAFVGVVMLLCLGLSDLTGGAPKDTPKTTVHKTMAVTSTVPKEQTSYPEDDANDCGYA